MLNDLTSISSNQKNNRKLNKQKKIIRKISKIEKKNVVELTRPKLFLWGKKQ